MDGILSCGECGARVRRKPGSTSPRWSCPKCGTVNSSEDSSTDESAVKPPAATWRETTVGSGADDSNANGSSGRTAKAPDNPAELLRALFAGFQGTIPRRRPSIGYRLALLVTSVGVVGLMLAFLATLAAGGYGLYWYALTILPTAWPLPGKMRAIVLAFHATVLLAGAGVLLSTLLPIVRRRRPAALGWLVPPSEATVLYSFVARIAEVLGAPAPREIRLSIAANASAGYLGGLRGLLRKDLVLTLGAPLLSGLTMRQLAGVVAHELGHFSQRGGTLVRYFVGSFTNWCLEVVEVQTELGEMTGEVEPDDNGMVLLIRAVMGLVQKLGTFVVWCFAILGLLLTTFVMRQQEYDADRYEVELAGSDAFRETMRRMVELGLGQQRIFKRGISNLLAVLDAEEGVGNFAAEVVAAADIAREKSAKQIEKELVSPTGWFDTHPGNRARLAAVEQSSRPGIFHLRMPAYRLCPTFNPNPVQG
jgi:Zn-dependent protease with chaperone function